MAEAGKTAQQLQVQLSKALKITQRVAQIPFHILAGSSQRSWSSSSSSLWSRWPPGEPAPARATPSGLLLPPRRPLRRGRSSPLLLGLFLSGTRSLTPMAKEALGNTARTRERSSTCTSTLTWAP